MSFENQQDYYSYDSRRDGWGQANRGLWEVDHRVANNPSLRFRPETSPLIESIIENSGGYAPMNGCPVPKGMLLFLQNTFLKPFNFAPSKYSPIEDVIKRIWHFLDYNEPYFYFTDMPVELTQDSYLYTFRHKKTGSVLDPQKIEVFKYLPDWNYAPYEAVKSMMTHPMFKRVLSGEKIPHGKENRNVTAQDLLAKIAGAVFGDWGWFCQTVDEWVWQYADDLVYDDRYCQGAEDSDRIHVAMEHDTWFWYVVALGVFTWLKSPYGLRFLTEFHPVYYEILEFDEDTQNIQVRKGTGGEAVIDGWSVYTHLDLDVIVNEKPGTCCVLKQELHCTKLVNAPAVKAKVCYCGKPLEMKASDYYGDHYEPACRKWRDQNPEHHVFISHGALYNVLNGLPPATRCPQHACPNTSCRLHAGQNMRVRALTDQRLKLIGSANATR